MKATSRHSQEGSTLAVVLTLMAVLMVTVGIAFQYTTNTSRQAYRGDAYQRALTIGDNAVEVMFTNWRTTCRYSQLLFSRPIPQTIDLSGIPTPSPFPNLPTSTFVKRGTVHDPANDSDYDSNYTISNYKVIAVSAEYQTLPGTTSTPEPQLGQVAADINDPSPSPSVPPTTSATYNYVASADVTLPSPFGTATSRNVVAHVRRVFSKQQLSPWNWAIFFIDPLEIHPGPQFTVNGWVHTNSDLYTGHSSLTFADKVSYTGDWYYPNSQQPTYGFMPGDGKHPETPTAPTWPANLPPARGQEQQPFGLDTSSVFDTTDSNPNNDGYHELIDPPNNAYSDPLVDDQMKPVRYYDQAGIIIKVDSANNVTIGQGDGNGGFTSINPPASGTDPRTSTQKNLYTMFNGAIATNTTIQDNREGAAVRLVKLDVSKLTALKSGVTNGIRWGTSSYDATNAFNGIVYIHDNSATSSARRGVELINGQTIPGTGLSVASQNPVYVQGDFNTGGAGAAVPSNDPTNLTSSGTYVNQANPPDPQVSGYTRAPCSIIADAVNILSNSWVDSNSGTVPAASPTTVNTAIVSGNVPTNVYGDNAYSGGAENFPRFLENWSNRTLTYYGSMVQLYQSQQSTGEWGKSNVYSPPAREWYFDSNFKASPPLGTIMIYNYTKGRWSVF